MRSAQPVNGRAETDEAKEQVMARLLEAWKKQPKMRLSQLIYVATGGVDIFYIEDMPFLYQVEEYVKGGKRD